MNHRYCHRCREITKFQLNKNIGHSECINCGSRLAIKNKKVIKKIIKRTYNYRIKEIEVWYNAQNLLINNFK